MSLLIKGPNGTRIAVLHFPKTSGTWVRETLKRVRPLNVKDSPCKSGISRHCGLDSWEGEKPELSFTLLRHPHQWLESWHRFNSPQFPTWEPGNVHPCRWSDRVVDKIGRGPAADFATYIDGVIAHAPDALDSMYLDSVDGVKHVYKMEHAPQMLEAVCRAAGCHYSAEKLAELVPPQNVSPKAETWWRRGQASTIKKLSPHAFELYENAL